MLNKKRKGFTIVELVIVIAVIAILAAVLIPTFAGIIDKANESADKQAVRQMNIALAAEAIENEPADVEDVIDILADAGFNSIDKLVPVSAGHGFYWSEEANMITLIRDEGENSPALIFPTEEAALNEAFEAAKTETKSAINFGANKAVESTDRTFFDLEPAAGGGTGGGSGGVTTVGEFKTALTAALETGGTVTLGDSIEITETISIPSEATATIDLNGKTLTLADPSTGNETYDVITVSGTLNITGGNVVIESTTNEYADIINVGICVNGELNLDGVNITGKRQYNIQNCGTTNLKNVQYTVNCGFGVYNGGGTATITNGEFVAKGEDVGPIQSEGGILNVTGTKFSEDTGFTSYYYLAPIHVTSSGTGTLENVTVTVSGDNKSANLASSSSLTIKSGSYSDPFACSGGSTIKIEGGTINGVAFADITAASEIFIGAGYKLTEDTANSCWVISESQS